MKGSHRFAEELGTRLNFVSPEPSCTSFQAPEKRIGGHQLKQHLKKAVGQKLNRKVGDQKWQGRLLWTILEDNQLSKHDPLSRAALSHFDQGEKPLRNVLRRALSVRGKYKRPASVVFGLSL